MNNCTCTKDKQITCIVHPTQLLLKEYIAELEEDLNTELAMKTMYIRSLTVLEAENKAWREAAQVALDKYCEEGEPEAMDALAKLLEKA